MYVLRRTVGTSISVRPKEGELLISLEGIDWLGACALIGIRKETGEETKHEMGPGEIVQLTDDVRFRLLRLSYATYEGTPARIAEFGFEAPRTIPIRLAEKQLDKA
jgi:hypothetical protein